MSVYICVYTLPLTHTHRVIVNYFAQFFDVESDPDQKVQQYNLEGYFRTVSVV
jgi:hypothetical protein